MPTIQPAVGVDALRFGMTKQEIDALLGPTRMTRRNPQGENSEIRTLSHPRVSIAENRLVEMSFMPAFGVLSLDGIDLFAADPIKVLQHVERSYGPLFIHVGFVVSLNAGLAFTGFHDRDETQKAVTVFEVGRWDRFYANLEPITFI